VLALNTKLAKAKPRGAQEGEQWYLVGKTPVITGREMRNARPSQGDMRKWETNFTLSPDGGKRFGASPKPISATRLAVSLDNSLVSVAVIESRIEDSGRHRRAEQRRGGRGPLALLRSGSLPAGVQYLEERSIGPSLGADSIHEVWWRVSPGCWP